MEPAGEHGLVLRQHFGMRSVFAPVDEGQHYMPKYVAKYVFKF